MASSGRRDKLKIPCGRNFIFVHLPDYLFSCYHHIPCRHFPADLDGGKDHWQGLLVYHSAHAMLTQRLELAQAPFKEEGTTHI
jgi:hypothetical protein